MADGRVVIETALDQSGAREGMDDLGRHAQGSAGKIGGVLGKAGGIAAKGIVTGLATAGGAVAALSGKAVALYGDYEQLTGGVETLFKDSQDIVMEYADNAFEAAGMSANEYMETVTGFSASLLQGLGGDTEKAAEISNMAIVDMSDNANKMGTSIDSIKNAYQGFAKQNYTMLDNLKLGYGGTQAEMARLINDSGVLGESIEITAETVKDVPFDKIIEAIHTVQTDIGITGTTAKEASTTIQGSAGAMKAAWDNLMIGVADDTQDFDTLVENFVGTVETFGENIMPRVETVLKGIVMLLSTLAPMILEQLPGIIETIIPGFANGAVQIVNSLIQLAPQLLVMILNLLAKNGKAIIDTFLGFCTELITTIGDNIPEIVDAFIELIPAIVASLSENTPKIIEAGLNLFLALLIALIEATPQILEELPNMVDQIVTVLFGLIPLLVEAGIKLFVALVQNMPAILSGIVSAVPKIIDAIKTAFGNYIKTMADIGLNLIKGIWQGMKDAAGWLKDKVIELCGGIVDSIKDFFGIHSPASKHMPWLGEMMAKGLAAGFKDENPLGQIEESLKAGQLAIESSLRYNDGQQGGVGYGGITQYITIEHDDNSPDEIARAIRTESRYGLIGGQVE